MTYRPLPVLSGGIEDTRPIERLPYVESAAETAEARDAMLAADVAKLEAQDYRIDRIDRWTECTACQGAGYLMVKPKGWRKHSEPPAWMMKRQRCEACGGRPRTIEVPGSSLEVPGKTK